VPAMPLWVWILFAIGVAVLFARRTVRAYRREVRVQFVAWLAKEHPDWTVRTIDDFRLAVTIPAIGETPIGLGRLFTTIAATRDRTAAARAHHYEAFARPLADQVIVPEDAARLRPRLVTREWLDVVPADQPVLHRPLGETGLYVAYVLDSPRTVTFVTEVQRAQLGLDADAVHARALANLRATFDPSASRDALAGSGLVTLKTADSFDAARLLLIPETLAAGEAVAACVPDRDTLVLSAVPKDWETLVPLARTAAGPPLLARPLLVTRAGIERK
jgi:hypothetical protein